MRLDLSDFESIVCFADNLCNAYLTKKIDILINNAGLISKQFRKTKNNIEQTLQANLIGSMILSSPLMEKKENEGKIINVFLKPTEYSNGFCENGVGRVKLKPKRCVKKANAIADANKTAASTKQVFMIKTSIKGRAKIRFSIILIPRY